MIHDTPILIGHGYDLHRLVRGRKLILGGVEIPSEMGLLGHSDADCLVHALSDAILGALGLPDIGHYFPDSSPENKDLDSLIILKKAVMESGKQGFKLGNIDLTLVLEAGAPNKRRVEDQTVFGRLALGLESAEKSLLGAEDLDG